MLNPGDLVGPYEIRGFVGQGGMGQVYRAFDPRLERTIALKVIAIPEDARGTKVSPADAAKRGDSLPRISDLSARLLREARAVASLSHPNVIAIYDVGESDGRLYLAMEFVVGSPLRSLVGNTELPLARRVRWLIDVARALEAAHRAGIIHRDIKPENVMIREDGAVKVLDFGIARRTVSSATSAEQAAIDTLTGSGTIAGTPVYMAPEQIKGGDVDARCDQFAWAVMAYELVVGERPWAETGDVLSLVAKILTEQPRPIRGRIDDVPAVVEETILRALSKDAGARFPAMADVAEALEPFATVTTGGERVRITPPVRTGDDPAFAATTKIPTTVSVAPSADPRAATVPPEPPRRRALSLALPLMLIGALGAGVWVAKGRLDARGTPPRVTVTTATTPLPSASTPRPLSSVPEAEATYREAMSLWHDGAGAKARASLNRAIELDPAFAAAHLQLALQQASAGDPAAAQAAFALAYEHRHMLTARDSLLLEASQPFVRPKPDIEEWETRMTAVVFQHPRDPDLQFYLGRAHDRGGDIEAAKDAYEKALKLDDGFVPALAALAQAQMNLGRTADGLATTERCIKRSPIASTCVQARYELLFAAGECKRARTEAQTWSTLEPQSPRPQAALARALHADGVPRPSVEEVLSRRWSLVPPNDRKQDETRDRLYLAVIDGDFARADELAKELEAGLPLNADSYDHAIPARVRANLYLELDKPKEAAKVARAFLDRVAAWPVYPFAPDPNIDFYEALFRAGEMSKEELVEKRNEWAEHERRRTDENRTAHDPWVIWAHANGSFAETREEALDALAKAPKDRRLPVGARRSFFLDYVLGKINALTGHGDEAIPSLRRIVESCATFDEPMVILKARYYLALVYEAKGETAKARALYTQVTETWPKGNGSKTVKLATERLATMTRN